MARVDLKEAVALKNLGYLTLPAYKYGGDASDAPTFVLLNYTDRAKYDRAFERYPSLLAYRGLVVNGADGTVVARPFRTFFNVGEPPSPPIPNLIVLELTDTPEVATKLDGSLVIFWYDSHANTWRSSTRGSFVSTQATAALAIWDAKLANGSSTVAPIRELTYVFELTGPQNHHVVRYAHDALTLIGIVNPDTGHEFCYAAVRDEAAKLGFPAVPLLPAFPGLEALRALDIGGEEGYVLFYRLANLRLKLKFESYRIAHRAVFGLSEHAVWESLVSGVPISTAFSFADDQREWIAAAEHALRSRFDPLLREADGRVAALFHEMRTCGLSPLDREDRKRIAASVLRAPRHFHTALFLAVDGKPFHEALWRLVEPSKENAFHGSQLGGSQ